EEPQVGRHRHHDRDRGRGFPISVGVAPPVDGKLGQKQITSSHALRAPDWEYNVKNTGNPAASCLLGQRQGGGSQLTTRAELTGSPETRAFSHPGPPYHKKSIVRATPLDLAPAHALAGLRCSGYRVRGSRRNPRPV